MGDNAVNLFVRIWSPISEWSSVKRELFLEIKKILETEGVEIAFSKRVVWFGEGKNEVNKATGC